MTWQYFHWEYEQISKRCASAFCYKTTIVCFSPKLYTWNPNACKRKHTRTLCSDTTMPTVWADKVKSFPRKCLIDEWQKHELCEFRVAGLRSIGQGHGIWIRMKWKHIYKIIDNCIKKVDKKRAKHCRSSWTYKLLKKMYNEQSGLKDKRKSPR